MGRLIHVALPALLLITPFAHAQPTTSFPPAVERWRPFIAEAAARFQIPEAWIAAVMRAESAGQTHRGGRPIRSRVGAIGLMQVMPATYADLRRQYGLGANPDNPRDNIHAGAAYLRQMYDRFGYPGLFAAYNAGPRRYAQHLNGRALPPETVNYMAQLARVPAAPDMPVATLDGMRLFFALSGEPRAPRRVAAPEPVPPTGLFVPLHRETEPNR